MQGINNSLRTSSGLVAHLREAAVLADSEIVALWCAMHNFTEGKGSRGAWRVCFRIGNSIDLRKHAVQSAASLDTCSTEQHRANFSRNDSKANVSELHCVGRRVKGQQHVQGPRPDTD